MPVTSDSAELALRNVVVRRPDGTELYRLPELSFGPSLVALTGPNGAGKSTLLKFLVGLNRTSTGEVTACGISKVQHPRPFARLIAYQMQNFSGYPQISGFEFLTYLFRLRGFGRSEAGSLAAWGLIEVGLGDVDLPLGAYSQGMLQRLGFAYAVRSAAPVCLMDEPFAGIDPQGRSDLLALLAPEAAQRIFVICTHHVDELLALGATRLEVGAMRAEPLSP